MKKIGLNLSSRNIYQTPNGRWVFRKKIKGQAIYRTLLSLDPPPKSDRIPESVMKEVEMIYGQILSNHKEEFDEGKLRKKRRSTIGEIIDAFEAWTATKILGPKTKRSYVNALLQILAEIYLPEFKNITGSRSGGGSLVDRRRTAVGKLSSDLLTADLLERWIALRLDKGPCYGLKEERHEEGSKKELKRVLVTIRSTIIRARCVFAKDGRVTGEMMDKKIGAYKDLILPDSLPDFLGKRTPKPGKTKYKAPNRVQILDLVKGLPELFETHPEAYKAFKIAYATGMRIDEIRNLKWSDIQDDGDGVVVTLEETKNGDERINEYLGERLYEELIEMRTDQTHVIGGGKSYRKHNLGKEVSDYFRRCGWKRRQCLHEIRKWFGCMLAKETGDLVQVMHALGHADVSTTRNHYHDKIGKSVNPDFAQSLPAPGLEKVA